MKNVVARQPADEPSTLFVVTRLFVLLGGLAAACVLTASAAAHKRPPLQHVTIFGDSVAAALNWDPTARSVLARGDRLTLELARRCRRLARRTAAVLEGGYELDTLPRLVDAALDGFTA